MRTFWKTFFTVLTAPCPFLGIGQSLAITLDELLLALGIVGGRGFWQRQHVTVHGFIVIGKVTRDIDIVRTRHAVFAGRAGNRRYTRYLIGNLRQQGVLSLRS